MEQQGIIITSVHFARIILHIEGRIQVPGKWKKAKIFLYDHIGGRIAPAHIDIDYENKTFSLRYNMMGAVNNYPLNTGDYYLMAEIKGVLYPAYVCEELHHVNKDDRMVFASAAQSGDSKWLPDTEKDNDYSLWLFKGKTNCFYALSKIDPDSDRYYLEVTYEIPAPGLNAREKIVRKFKRIAKSFQPFVNSREEKYYAKLLARKKEGGKKTILFASAARSEIGGNEEFIYKRLVERGLDKDFNILFNFVGSIEESRGLHYSRKLIRQLAASDIIMIDDYFPFMYKFKYPKNVKFVQVWHACGAFKAIGLERMDKPGSPSFSSPNHKCYTHMPVSSPTSGLHNAEGFGLPEDRFLPIGVPRTDMFFDEDYKKEVIARLHQEIPLLNQRDKVILYGPTFRGNGMQSAYFPFEMIDLNKWGAFCKEHNALLIIKMHPFVQETAVIPEEYQDYILDLSSYREVNDILMISDVMITDYSSIIYEYSLLHRPMYFYAFDQRKYESKRDFYEPYADIVPGKIIKNFDTLLEELEKDDYDYDVLDAFIKKNFTYTDGKSTDRFIDQIILGEENVSAKA